MNTWKQALIPSLRMMEGTHLNEESKLVAKVNWLSATPTPDQNEERGLFQQVIWDMSVLSLRSLNAALEYTDLVLQLDAEIAAPLLP